MIRKGGQDEEEEEHTSGVKVYKNKDPRLVERERSDIMEKSEE